MSDEYFDDTPRKILSLLPAREGIKAIYYSYEKRGEIKVRDVIAWALVKLIEHKEKGVPRSRIIVAVVREEHDQPFAELADDPLNFLGVCDDWTDLTRAEYEEAAEQAYDEREERNRKRREEESRGK